MYPYNHDSITYRDIRPLFNPITGYESGADEYSLLTQSTYPYRIVTPTHEAIFYSSPRWDVSYLAPTLSDYNISTKSGAYGDFSTSTPKFVQPLQLDSVVLYRRQPRDAVSRVDFSFAPDSLSLCRLDSTTAGSSGYEAIGTLVLPSGILAPDGRPSVVLHDRGKLTLKGITFRDRSNSALPGYSFKYTDEVDSFNPKYFADFDYLDTYIGPSQALLNKQKGSFRRGGDTYYRSRSNRMGYFFAYTDELTGFGQSAITTNGAAAWSLRFIRYPTGVVDTIDYENDAFDPQDSAASRSPLGGLPSSSNPWKNFPPNECGIRVKTIRTFDSLSQTRSTFEYEYPNGHIPGLPHSYLRINDHYYANPKGLFTLYGWSSNDVEYPWIREKHSDNSTIVRHFTTAADSGNKYYNRQYFMELPVQDISLRTIMSMNMDWLRGRTTKTEQFNSAGQLVNIESNRYGLLLIDSNKVSYGGMKFGPESWSVLLTKEVRTTYNQNGSKPILDSTEYGYNSHGLQKWQVEYNKSGLLKRTEQSYVSDGAQSAASMFFEKHILSSVDSIRVYSADTLKSFSRVLYADFNSGADTQLYVQSKKVWRDDNTNHTVDAGETFSYYTVSAYDKYGNPLAIEDANGIHAFLEWDSTYAHALLTNRTKAGLSKKFKYNKMHKVTEIADENGLTTYYDYDGFWRLVKTRGPNQKTTQEVEYHLKNQ